MHSVNTATDLETLIHNFKTYYLHKSVGKVKSFLSSPVKGGSRFLMHSLLGFVVLFFLSYVVNSVIFSFDMQPFSFTGNHTFGATQNKIIIFYRMLIAR